jgi:hypothetical protein
MDLPAESSIEKVITGAGLSGGPLFPPTDRDGCGTLPASSAARTWVTNGAPMAGDHACPR